MSEPRPRLRVEVTPAVEDAQEAVARLLRHVGQDPAREGLRETPRRVVRALEEMTQGYREDPAAILSTTFDEPCEEAVVLRGVPFWSLCEHHLLPFRGTATLAYVPDGRVVGLSKLARLVQCFARRLQVQESMTHDIAHALATHLRAKGVAVVVEAEHTCMQMRGVRSPGTMRTAAYLGTLRDPDARRAALEGAP